MSTKYLMQQLAINELVKEFHQTAVEHGWWEEPKTFGELIALIHSEVSEALEEFRNGHDPKETYYTKDKQGNDKPEGIPSELADIVIRVFDLCGYYNIDIVGMLFEKSEYNKSRPYKHGGKKI